jgi:hypothetical protein
MLRLVLCKLGYDFFNKKVLVRNPSFTNLSVNAQFPKLLREFGSVLPREAN